MVASKRADADDGHWDEIIGGQGSVLMGGCRNLDLNTGTAISEISSATRSARHDTARAARFR
jgi:hypothetical protein